VDTRRQQLIEQHVHLVEPAVRRIAAGFPRFVDRDELISAGHLGLAEAATTFDFDRGVPFAPFASRRITGAVLDSVRNDDWTPRRVRRQARAVELALQRLTTRLHREPTDAELAAEVGIDGEELLEVRRHVQRGHVEFLDRPATADGATLAEQLTDPTRLEPHEVMESSELRGYLRAALAHLPERLRFVVTGYYLEGRQLDELARVMGVTPSRVSQLRADAIELIRNGLDAQYADCASLERPDQGTRRKDARRAQYAASIAQHSAWRQRFDPSAGLPHVAGDRAVDTEAVPA
jgi:RNA polymerase sigma factor for flagellar operon FliA